MIPGTKRVPRVSATTFAEYLTASASSKIDCVKDQIRIYDQPYRMGPAFYQDFIDAVIQGRASGADHLAIQRIVSAQRDPARQRHYADLAQHWLALCELQRPLVPHGRAEWLTPRLTVSLRPDFAGQDADGQLLTVKLGVKERELGKDAARAMLWLYGRYMAEIRPGAIPLVADVRREKIYRPDRRPVKKGYDAWLVAEAGAFAELWSQLAAA